ncbi:ferredoxin-type protein NapF [Hydrogenimonas sp.]
MIDRKRRSLFAPLGALLGEQEATEIDSVAIRPPYNTDTSLFHMLCPSCEAKSCVKACEEEIISVDPSGIPTLDFSTRGCTFCGACADACTPGVLSDKTINCIQAKVEIDILKCIAWHGVLCSSCKDPCQDDAIAFLGLFRPEIEDAKCTACGWCAHVCPADAIIFTNKGEA